ncbi:seed lectin-like [Wolffia australiana]
METTSFDFPSFSPLPASVFFQGDGSVVRGSLELNNDAQYSYGRAVYSEPVHLWDKKTGKIASFSTRFSFSVIRDPSAPGYGDGMAFFLAPVGYALPENTTGGELTLFNSYNESPAAKAPVVALEFDTYQNEWDTDVPHIGINVGYIDSEKERSWDPFWGSDDFTATAEITYDPENTRIKASFTQENGNNRELSYTLDLRKQLPEMVTIGFAGSTGYYFERHAIHSWSFSSNLELSNDSGNSISATPSPLQEPSCSAPSPPEKKSSAAMVGSGLAGAAALAIITSFLLRYRSRF